jgi:hypothetical protein
VSQPLLNRTRRDHARKAVGRQGPGFLSPGFGNLDRQIFCAGRYPGRGVTGREVFLWEESSASSPPTHISPERRSGKGDNCPVQAGLKRSDGVSPPGQNLRLGRAWRPR